MLCLLEPASVHRPAMCKAESCLITFSLPSSKLCGVFRLPLSDPHMHSVWCWWRSPMRINDPLTSTILWISAALATQANGGFTYDKSIHGDLSDNRLNPSTLLASVVSKPPLIHSPGRYHLFCGTPTHLRLRHQHQRGTCDCCQTRAPLQAGELFVKNHRTHQRHRHRLQLHHS